MDLDKLLASLQNAVITELGSPMIAADNFVPQNSKDPEADTEAARRMIAAFLYWLAWSDRVAAEAAPERAVGIRSTLTSRPEQLTTILKERLDDKILQADVRTEWTAFASAYLSPIEGGLGDDYFKIFVESGGLRSLREAFPTQSEYEQIAKIIENRAARFNERATDWNKPLDPSGVPAPSLWQGGTKEFWLQRLATYQDLMDSPAGLYRSRLAEYWSLVDAAPSIGDADAASALVKTYLSVDDSSIQQAVYRALGSFPHAAACRGVLAHIVDIESKTSWADTIVDVFHDDLGEAELAELAQIMKSAPLEQQAAYARALTRAQRNGSLHAARMLKVLSE